MKIAIEALGIHSYGGGRSATLNLLEALFGLENQNEYMVFLTQPEPSLVPFAAHVTQRIVPIRGRFAARLWVQANFPRLMQGYDLVHYSKNLGTFFVPIPSVVTMYDMTTLLYPELFPAVDVWYWRTIQRATMHQATRIISISENTADDLVRFYNLDREKIRVIYPAYADHFRLASDQDVQAVRTKYGLPERFIVHIGRIDRKKNLTYLVKAFAQLRAQNLFDGKLVLVGEEYPKSRDETLLPTIEELGLTDEVRFTGSAPDGDLPGIYGASTAAVYCSLHEGFGIVALEAMACGAPLLVTPAGAIGEAAGDAALVVDPAHPESLADALAQVVNDEEKRAQMRAAGLAHVQKFSWHDAAVQTLNLYHEICGMDYGSVNHSEMQP